MIKKIFICLLLFNRCMPQIFFSEPHRQGKLLPRHFISYPYPSDLYEKSFQTFNGNCSTYHWIFAIEGTSSKTLISSWIIRYHFQCFFDKLTCHQFMSTFSIDQKVTYYEEFVKESNFRTFLPNTLSNGVHDFGVAFMAAINLIISYEKENTCVVFVSDGRKTSESTNIQIYKFVINQMQNCYGRCMCSVCLFTGEKFQNTIFFQACKDIGAFVYTDENPWYLANRFRDYAFDKIYNSKQNC